MKKNLWKGIVLLSVALALGVGLLLTWGPIFSVNAADAWYSLGNGLNDTAQAVVIANDNVYYGGSFTTAGGVPAYHVARWNETTSTWSSVGGGVNGTVYALAWDDTHQLLIVGGQFMTAYDPDGSSVTVNNIAIWNGSNWLALSNGGVIGVNGPVRAIALNSTDDHYYFGGYFLMAGNVSVNNVTYWNTNTQTFSNMAGGVNSEATSLAMDELDNLYIGGLFNQAGGIGSPLVSVMGVVRMSAAGFYYPLGEEGAGDVYSLATGNGNVFVAVNTQGIHPSGYVKKWDGVTWESIVSVEKGISCLAWDSGDNLLYISGNFLDFGSSVIYWSQANGQLKPIDNAPPVMAIAAKASSLDADGYVAGGFTEINSSTVNRAARFNMGIWGATQTVAVGATETAQVKATQTAIVGATQTALAAPTKTAQAALTQTAQAGGATQTAWAATQTANAPTPTLGPLYLPLALDNFSACNGMSIDEIEPNDIIADATEVCLGAILHGAHDGATGSGDFFYLPLAAGQQLQASLDTDSGTGVQLLLYRLEAGAPVQEVQDTNSPFVIDYTAQVSGEYLVYVYSPAEANNLASYELHLKNAGLR